MNIEIQACPGFPKGTSIGHVIKNLACQLSCLGHPLPWGARMRGGFLARAPPTTSFLGIGHLESGRAYGLPDN